MRPEETMGAQLASARRAKLEELRREIRPGSLWLHHNGDIFEVKGLMVMTPDQRDDYVVVHVVRVAGEGVSVMSGDQHVDMARSATDFFDYVDAEGNSYPNAGKKGDPRFRRMRPVTLQEAYMTSDGKVAALK